MVKKYFQDKKDRADESRGMKKYEESRKMDSSYYGMISEDHSKPANLPQEVIQKAYPKTRYFNSSELDDTIRGLDDTRNDDIRKMSRYESDSKG